MTQHLPTSNGRRAVRPLQDSRPHSFRGARFPKCTRCIQLILRHIEFAPTPHAVSSTIFRTLSDL